MTEDSTDGAVACEARTERRDLAGNRPVEPTEANTHWRAERALSKVWENPEEDAVLIESSPNPMYVTVEDGELTFWCYDYEWRRQEQSPVEDSISSYETVVDELHMYANRGYGISITSKSEIDTEGEPRGTSLTDFH